MLAPLLPYATLRARRTHLVAAPVGTLLTAQLVGTPGRAWHRLNRLNATYLYSYLAGLLRLVLIGPQPRSAVSVRPAPHRRARTTVTRGPMVRKKQSREQATRTAACWTLAFRLRPATVPALLRAPRPEHALARSRALLALLRALDLSLAPTRRRQAWGGGLAACFCPPMSWFAALLALPCTLGLLVAARALARAGLCGLARRAPARPLFEDLGWFVRPSLFGGVFLGWSLLSRIVLVALVSACAHMCHALLLLTAPRRPRPLALAPARGAYVRLNAAPSPAPSPAPSRPRARRRANARLPLLQDGWRRFLEHFFGSEVFFVLNRNVWPHLAVAARVPLFLLGFRLVQYARDAMGRVRGAWWLGAHALCVALRYRDPQFLLYWLQTRFQHMRLQAHQRYFRLLGVMLRAGVRRAPSRWYLRGVHMRVVGKISVTGNAMSRTQWTRAGLASTSSLGLQATESFTLVWTSTGCLGLTVVFFV